MNKSRYTLPNGVTLEGTIEQIRTIAKTLGYTVNFQGYYESSTRGLVKIADMETSHIRNAMSKLYREWVAELTALSNTDLLNKLASGPDTEVFIQLY